VINLRKVFITDAGYKHTLGAVRSLGKKGFYVIAGASGKHAQSFYSKYCNESIIYPDPRDETRFIDFLVGYLKKNEVDVLLPIGYLATVAISKHKDEFLNYTEVPVADYQSMQVASDKYQTMRIARELGIPTPREYNSIGDVNVYPIVAKGIYESGQVRYINSAEELSQISFSDHILQEYVPGEGFGFYALFNRGEVRAIFMHKRLREYPVTGGSSTAARSIYDPELKDLGLTLLKALNWHGAAMVEFKKDSRDGTYKLMEINPKFWGSLDLSIASGVDFPYLAVLMALEGDIQPVLEYDKDVRFRWPFPDDTLHVLANPWSAKHVIRDIFDKNAKSNIVLDDMKPNLLQLYQTGISVVGRVRRGNLRYPHGKPEIKI
jgi:predicted ATP-grasp superfamily ATP-dependent carboligase